MTRLPAESWNVQPCEGDLFPRYKVKSMCAHPLCSRFVDHAHHIVRRSFIGGDVAWVKFDNGDIAGNLCGLCWHHHEDITVNRAHIAYEERLHQYTWVDEGGVAVGKLNPHPPMHGQAQEEHVHTIVFGPGSTPTCETCHRPLPMVMEKTERDPARRRKTWTVRVPDEAEEDGALVLDTLLEECATLFGREMSSPNVRYFVLAQALALILQNATFLTEKR